MKKSTSFVFDRYHNLFLRMLTRTRKWMQQSSESSSSDLEQSSTTKTADTMSYPWPLKDMATLLLWVKYIICVWRVLPKMGLSGAAPSSAWCVNIPFDVTSCHPHRTANLYATACVFHGDKYILYSHARSIWSQGTFSSCSVRWFSAVSSFSSPRWRVWMRGCTTSHSFSKLWRPLSMKLMRYAISNMHIAVVVLSIENWILHIGYFLSMVNVLVHACTAIVRLELSRAQNPRRVAWH